ncbi:hypothetical protein [Burkholderia cenocepacia]|uniref:hypothetical protein n=1 Tax=Burkholderia cenocepacia TaxID=95486 RepID=UPI0026545FEF|nr:hypothetical protein [Burkholderia cenocepacia]MDN7640373.1 hypothetical protein [Burkholderia cenocepacia]
MLDVDVTSAEQAVPRTVISPPNRHCSVIACVGTGAMLPKQAHCMSGRLEEGYVVDTAGGDARKID